MIPLVLLAGSGGLKSQSLSNATVLESFSTALRAATTTGSPDVRQTLDIMSLCETIKRNVTFLLSDYVAGFRLQDYDGIPCADRITPAPDVCMELNDLCLKCGSVLIEKTRQRLESGGDVVSAVYTLAVCYLFGWGVGRDPAEAAGLFRSGSVLRDMASQTDPALLASAYRLYYYCAMCAKTPGPKLDRRDRRRDWAALADYLFAGETRNAFGTVRRLERAGRMKMETPDNICGRRIKYFIAESRGVRQCRLSDDGYIYVRSALLGGIPEDVEAAANLLFYLGTHDGSSDPHGVHDLHGARGVNGDAEDPRAPYEPYSPYEPYDPQDPQGVYDDTARDVRACDRDEMAIAAMLGFRGLFRILEDSGKPGDFQRFILAQSDDTDAYNYALNCLDIRRLMSESNRTEGITSPDAQSRMFALAIAWLKMLADKGYADAQLKLADVLKDSDADLAISYLRIHAEEYESSKKELFDRIYTDGDRFDEAFGIAKELYPKYDAIAMWLGKHYFDRREYDKALSVWRSHAGRGLPAVDMRLSYCCVHGLGAQRDYQLAYAHIREHVHDVDFNDAKLTALMMQTYNLGTNDAVRLVSMDGNRNDPVAMRKWHVVMGLHMLSKPGLRARAALAGYCAPISRTEIPNSVCMLQHVGPFVAICGLCSLLQVKQPGQWSNAVTAALDHFREAAVLGSGFANVLWCMLNPEKASRVGRAGYISDVCIRMSAEYRNNRESFTELLMIVPFMTELIAIIEGTRLRLEASVETDKWVRGKKLAAAAELGDGRAAFTLSKESPTLREYKPRIYHDIAMKCNIGAAYLVDWYIADTNGQASDAINGVLRLADQPVGPDTGARVADIALSRLKSYKFRKGQRNWLYNAAILPVQRIRAGVVGERVRRTERNG